MLEIQDVIEYYHFYNKSKVDLIMVGANEKTPIKNHSWTAREYNNSDVLKYIKSVHEDTNGKTTGNFSFIIPKDIVIIDLDLKHLKDDGEKFIAFMIKFLKYFPDFAPYVVGRHWNNFFENAPFIVVKTPNRGFHIYARFTKELNSFLINDLPHNPEIFKVDGKAIVEFKYTTPKIKMQIMAAGSTIQENGMKKAYEIVSLLKGGLNINLNSIALGFDKIIEYDKNLTKERKSQNSYSNTYSSNNFKYNLDNILEKLNPNSFRGDYDRWKKFILAIACLINSEEDESSFIVWCESDIEYTYKDSFSNRKQLEWALTERNKRESNNPYNPNGYHLNFLKEMIE